MSAADSLDELAENPLVAVPQRTLQRVIVTLDIHGFRRVRRTHAHPERFIQHTKYGPA
jgi:hypothetical protein